MWTTFILTLCTVILLGISFSFFVNCENLLAAITLITAIAMVSGAIFFYYEDAPRFHDVETVLNGYSTHIQSPDTPECRIPEERIQFLVSLWAERLEDPALGVCEVAKNLKEDHNINSWVYCYRQQ